MQDMTSAQCYHAEIGETKQLVDKRDNKKYWVTKLKDGNCWMTQNLDYDGPSGTEITSATTWIIGYNQAAYYNPGDYYIANINDWSLCPDTSVTFSECLQYNWSTSGNKHYHIGNYYSWAAATNTTGNNIPFPGEAPDSICPDGWQLPGNESNDHLSKLITAYGIENDNIYTVRNAPLYFVSGGRISKDSLYGVGRAGYYWSSAAFSNSSAYFLYFTSSQHDYVHYANNFGHSVRCLVLGS